jgi:hypothetical protein
VEPVELKAEWAVPVELKAEWPAPAENNRRHSPLAITNS